MEDEQGLSLEGEQQDKEQEVHVDQKQKQQEQKKSDAVASSNSSGKKSNKNEYKVRVVAQRCDNAELLVDNKSKWIGIGRGLILHVSFAKGCDSSCLPKVVRTLLRIPLLTEGVWGDGNAPMSVVDMCQKIRNDAKEGEKAPSEGKGKQPSVMIIPQASLISTAKGKGLTYFNQCDKEVGRGLYKEFVQLMQNIAHENITGVPIKQPKKKKEAVVLCSPEELYKTGEYKDRFSTFDENFIPVTDANGEAVTKSMKKRLQKQMAVHTRKWEKQATRVVDGTNTVASEAKIQDEATKEAEPAKEDDMASESPEDCALHVVWGTFGNRQGLKIEAEMGPFTHVFEF
eukprot:m.174277 g.174277  ORF g.174277 m.174277 type:complete len:343 (+) comp15405_c0_seq4:12-1040(+)